MPSMYFRTTIPEHLLALILFIEEKHHENVITQTRSLKILLKSGDR